MVKTMIARRGLQLGLVALALLLGTQVAVAGNKKLMTVNAAKVAAERAIVESVIVT